MSVAPNHPEFVAGSTSTSSTSSNSPTETGKPAGLPLRPEGQAEHRIQFKVMELTVRSGPGSGPFILGAARHRLEWIRIDPRNTGCRPHEASYLTCRGVEPGVAGVRT